MATADQYAAWIVQNQAKRGTPEFNTVAQAYQQAKAEEARSTESAGFSLGDTARAAQQGLYGGLQSLTDLFGAGNAVSKDLSELQQESASKMSEERKQEIARRELIKKQAEGNTWEEIKATLGGFAEAPIQTSVGALASSAPIIAGSLLAPEAAVVGGAARAGMGARALAAAKSPAAGIGALMGVGGQKGQDYEAVKQALLAKNYSEAEAERLAQQVSGYSLENAPRQLASGFVGGLEGVTGIEGLLGRAGRLGKALPKVDKSVNLPEPTYGQALRKNILGEAAPEAVQASTGQVGTNIALNQAGIPTDLTQGVAAQAIHDALVGGTLGAATSPLKMREMRQEFVNDEIARKREEDAKIAEGIKKAAAQREQTKEQIVGKQPLLLAGPSEEIQPTKETPPLQNPIGNLTPDELGPEVTSYLNQYRKDNGLPRLKTYSIEDVKDAMTAVNPEGEKAALDSILAAKTGYTGQQNFSAKDVENAAIEKNVATGTKGFSDFLARTTGVNSLDQMSEPQLYAAFKALSDMPANTTGQQIVLPEGTNASRFTQKQYDGAVKYVGLSFEENNGKPLSTETILSEIKDATNLTTDRDAKALLDTAINNGDLEKSEQVVYRTFNPNTDQMVATYPTRERAVAAAEKQGLNVRESTLTQVAPKAPVTPPAAPRAGLPAGYDITERQFKEGEQPEGYQITSEEGGKPFPTVLNEAEVQGKIDQLSTDRREIADQKLQEVMKYEQVVNEGKRELEKMEAAGNFDTDEYKQKKARQAAKEDLLGKRIEALYKEIGSLTAPLKSKPVGSKPIARKGFTVTKEGKEVGTFPTREAAEDSVLAGLSDAELEALVSDKKFGGLQTRIINEQNRRSGKAPVDYEGKPLKTKKVSEVLKDLESGPPLAETPELLAKTKPLRDMLNRFGLGDVALKLVKAIENKADGSYAGKVIELALDAKFPVRTLRHESLHALKELGFFTDAQWQSLEKMARDKWIKKYLEGSTAVLQDGTTGTRLQAYNEMGLSEADIIEEAIADAFGDFDANKPPPGMLMSLLKKLRGFFESLNNYLAGRGYQNSQDIFGAIEKGELKAKPAAQPQGDLNAEPSSWKATPEETEKADKYFAENGIMPYTSEGQQEVPVEVNGKKFSIKGAYTEAQAEARVKKRRDGSEVVVPAKFNDPITGLPMNADGTVTLYYPTTNEIARGIATAKKLTAHSPTANRIYLTNESSANAVAENPGIIDQPLGGANVMFKVDPNMIELGQVYENGRRDFFIPIAEGEVFAKKMKMTKLFTVNAPRDKGLHPDRTLSQVTEGIEKATEAWKNANSKERAEMFSEAKDVLREQHNIGTLFGANAKLEKTNIGDYGLMFKGKKVMSTGLGFASAQKINDKSRENTCPKSAICEALCLGETSGQNELYGGEGQFRSGPRMSQYLKTEAFVVNPEAFAISLIRQIENFRNSAKKLGYYPAIRLNVTSDFPAKMFKPVIEMFPDVQFYDYTKLETKPIAENHHLTYSSTGASQEVNGNVIYNKESNWDRVVDKILSAGKNVAMAFTSRNDMPKFVRDERTGQTFEVWNGDEYDARFLDPVRDDGKGWIVGLTNKDRTTAPEEAASRHNGFFLDYDKARDGDTLVIKDQKRLADEFKGKPPEPTPPSTFKGIPVKKMSLREAPDTPEFKRFFGRSGFINSSGTPMTMYHATDADITEFKSSEDGKLGAGIYVSSIPDYVTQYAPEGNVMPLYVSAQNPFILNISSDSVKSTLESKLPFVNGINKQMEAAVTLLTEGKKRLKDLSGQQVQNLFKRNGYDGILARDDEGNIIEATVFKPQQVKSATGNTGTFSPKSKDIRYSLRDATDMFEPSEVEKYATQSSKSKIKLVNMPIDDFLKLAEFGHNKNKEIAAEERLKAGIKSNTLPVLTIYKKDGDLQVYGHEGRHRARALQKAGYTTMPVVWEGNIIWGAQTDPEAWGYEPKWPDRIYAQKGALREGSSIAMPFTREEGTQNYQAPAKKFSVRSVEDHILAMPNGADIHKAVVGKTTAREEKSIARRILDAFAGDSIATLRQQALNRYNQLSVYDKRLADQMGGKELLADSSAEAAALLSDTASGVAAAAFGVNNIGGAPVYRNGVTVVDNFNGEVKGLMDILMPLAELKDPFVYRAFQFYAASKRGSRFEADGRELLFNSNDYAYAAALEIEYPMFKQVHADWIKYNDKLVDYMVSTGIISKGKAAEFTKYADYIPFYRQLEGQDTVGPKVFQSISGVKAPKKLKGDSEAPLADFMETIVRNTQSIIQAGMKNTAGQKAVDVALALNDAQKLDKQSSAPGTITIMRDGEYVSYAVDDELFINSVKSLNMPDVKLWGIFAGPAGLLRNMVTKDPGFMLANLLRDSMSAYVTSGVKMTPVADTVANFGRALGGKDPAYQALVKAGVLGGYDYAQGVEKSGAQLTADLRKRTGNQSLGEKAMDGFGLWSALEKGTSASDAATRMAVYNKVLEETGNEAEAIFRALEVMNFNRKGSNPMVRLLTAAIPFLNARMQGLDVFYRAGISPFLDKNPTERQKAVQKAFFVRGMYLTSLTVAYWAMTHDDDDYLKQEQETRDNNWLIPSMGIKIPIPFEVGVLFKVIPERLLGYYMGDDTGEDFSASMGRAAWSTFGFLPVPQTALPMLEAATNYSFYTGRNIVGAGMEGVSPEFQKGPSTTKVASYLGEQLGLSPLKIDHMIKGYTGTIGTYMVDLMDSIGDLNSESPKAAKRFEQMPVLKRFALDPEAKGTVTAYYNLKNAVDETVRTINLLEKTGNADALADYIEKNGTLYATRHYVSSMEKKMKVLREYATKINNSPLSADEKREALSAINQAQINMTKHVQLLRKTISE